MVDEWTAFAAVSLLAAITLATRISGPLIMSYVVITPRIEAFLKYMATSVLISIVLPATLKSEPRIWLAVAASTLVAATGRGVMSAMLTGIAVAAAAHALGF
jgi:uncharacterized membrane protein